MSEVTATAKTIPQTAKERGKIAPVKFAHVVYRTARYAEMIDWYTTVLEAETVMVDPFITFISYDDEHHRVAFANMPNLQDRSARAAGVEHIAYTYETLDDLFATYERLKDLDITPYWCINHGPTLSMYYRDPDANQVELQIDIYADSKKATEWFLRSDFTANPIGVKFVPEEIINRYRDGEAKDTLLERPTIDPSDVPNQFPTAPPGNSSD